MEYGHEAIRVGTEHGNRHWARSMAGGNGAWMVGTGHAWKAGLKVVQALRWAMGIEDEPKDGHGAWKGHDTDSKRRNSFS
jgi:hypothetical protein